MMRILCLLVVAASALKLQERVEVNPIRRIVNMLQHMSEKITDEGRKEDALYEKFYCYCKKGAGGLTKDISDGDAKSKELTQEIEQDSARKTQLDQEVDQHRKDRTDAKAAIEKATAIREKEKKEYDDKTKDSRQNLDALDKAVKVLSKGMGKAFLQVTANREALKRAVEAGSGVLEMERDQVFSFLSSPYGDYQASGGEIVGILKTMADEMDKDLGGVVKEEKTAVKAFDELMDAKREVIAQATKSLESKIKRSGELAVEIVELKNDLSNKGKEMAANKEFLANLGKNCKKKADQFEERKKKRAEELEAISQAVAVLNNDDALDIFKKTLPSPKAVGAVSLLQTDSPVSQAAEFLNNAMSLSQKHSSGISLIAYMLRVSKVDFSKIVKMIDNMITHLHEEQKDDEEQLAYCNKELDANADKKKSLEGDINDLNKETDSLEHRMGELKDEIADLEKKIAETQDMMKDATEQREKEHAQFLEEQSMNNAAKQLIEKAKNRLNKFYNPSLYKPPPQRELTDQERIAQNMGEKLPTEAPQYIKGTKITVNMQLKKNPGPPPKTWSGGLKKKTQESTGIIALMDMCLKDVEKDMLKKKLEEETAQKDYESAMEEGKKNFAADTKSKTGNESALAEANSDHQKAVADRKSKNDELVDTNKVIENLHHQCDFLIKNFDYRKEARTNEIDALGKAKAVLSGANYS